MNCPFCQAVDNKVLDSRPDSEGRGIRRRRECLKCERRWRTVERVDDVTPLVIKKNLAYEPFDRNKLLRSMKISCGKRPVPVALLENAVADIEWTLLETGADTVTSTALGEQVMEALKKIDDIAYVRYASVYRRFRDVSELVQEMKDLITENAGTPAPHGPQLV
jgi:transcriptional repressor NrdR